MKIKRENISVLLRRLNLLPDFTKLFADSKILLSEDSRHSSDTSNDRRIQV
jgi:hypothetical protein